METQHALKTVESIAPIARLVVPVLIQNVPILREKCHILDLGTGLGGYLIQFALNNPNLTGVGVDGGWVAAIVYEARKNVAGKTCCTRRQFLPSPPPAAPAPPGRRPTTPRSHPGSRAAPRGRGGRAPPPPAAGRRGERASVR
jgi:hypothetical protein